MTKPIIQVTNISKQYTIGERVAYGSLREEIMQTLTAPFKSIRHGAWRMAHRAKTDLHPSGSKPLAPGPMPSDSTIWALKDVSFDVHEGEVVGIIGRNGAGKSTLLKILSRITEPTSGRIEMRGRVASLLEVGTGFHPELTGRENILLNGALLGMTKEEIKSKFDEIVAFSEIEKFLDTPVKRYSSGMYVRLAFAVAAHLEQEILLVDEVLAVGDVGFQKKCLGKMEELGQKGKTVLLVSHNISSVTRLCSRGILLSSGMLQADGTVNEVASLYMTSDTGSVSYRKWDNIDTSPGNEIARLKSVRAFSKEGDTGQVFDIRYPIVIEIEYWVREGNVRLSPGFFLLNEDGIIVFISGGMHDPEWTDRPRLKGLYKSRCWIPGNFLAEGRFNVHAVVNTMRPDQSPIVHVYERDAISFQVYDKLEGDSARGIHRGKYYGVVRPILDWKTWREDDPA